MWTVCLTYCHVGLEPELVGLNLVQPLLLEDNSIKRVINQFLDELEGLRIRAYPQERSSDARLRNNATFY